MLDEHEPVKRKQRVDRRQPSAERGEKRQMPDEHEVACFSGEHPEHEFRRIVGPEAADHLEFGKRIERQKDLGGLPRAQFAAVPNRRRRPRVEPGDTCALHSESLEEGSGLRVPAR